MRESTQNESYQQASASEGCEELVVYILIRVHLEDRL